MTRIQDEFDKLTAENKINSESTILFKSMLMLIHLLAAIFLEKLTKKNNKNSSKPSSQTEKDDSSTLKAGSKGKGKLESDDTAHNTRTVQSVTLNSVEQCDVCGQDLRKTACEHIERRTKIDIVFEKVVEQVDVEVKTREVGINAISH